MGLPGMATVKKQGYHGNKQRARSPLSQLRSCNTTRQGRRTKPCICCRLEIAMAASRRRTRPVVISSQGGSAACRRSREVEKPAFPRRYRSPESLPDAAKWVPTKPVEEIDLIPEPTSLVFAHYLVGGVYAEKT